MVGSGMTEFETAWDQTTTRIIGEGRVLSSRAVSCADYLDRVARELSSAGGARFEALAEGLVHEGSMLRHRAGLMDEAWKARLELLRGTA